MLRIRDLAGTSLLLYACAGKSEGDHGRLSTSGSSNGFGGSELVAGSVSFGGSAPVAGSISVAGSVSFAGSMSFGGSLPVAGSPSFAGAAAEVTGGGDSAGAAYDSGGSSPAAGAGTALAGDGGAPGKSAGGSVGFAGSSSAGGPPNCNNVNCPSIPSSCKHLVQSPGDCCPTCTDTGCDACPPIDCQPGTHSETAQGACCPSCVADPPDACMSGQMTYRQLRGLLLHDGTPTDCKNSSECSLVTEDNVCAFVCNVPVTKVYAPSFISNLTQHAPELCATCTAPVHIDCSPKAAACLNGICVAAEPANP